MDSLIRGLLEKKMGNKVKVRGFYGACINDMYSYLKPLLKKTRVTYLWLAQMIPRNHQIFY